MFTAIVIGADSDRAGILRELALRTGQLLVLRELAGYPSSYELARLLNTREPEVVILDLAAGQRAFESAAEVRERAHDAALIGYGCRPEQAALAQAVGFNSLIGDTVHVEDLVGAIDDAVHKSRGGVEPQLYSFLPAKAGSGATTVVCNLAATLAGPLEQKVLVIEADLRSGVLGVMLNVTPRHSVQELLPQASELDSFRWENAIVRAWDVHWLLTTRAIDARPPSWNEYYQVLNFARSRYDFILVDLPELINPATVEIVRRSQMVFSIATPELLALKMTEQRAAEVAHWGLPGARHGIVLNRTHGADLSPEEVARLLKRPVLRSLPNDYPAVRQAVMEGRPVRPDTRLGKAYLEFARHLAGGGEPAQASLSGVLKGLLKFRSQPAEVSPARRTS